MSEALQDTQLAARFARMMDPVEDADWPEVETRADAIAVARTELESAIGREPARRRASRRRRRFVALAVAALAGAASAALFVSTPWKSSRGFLERAQAALTPPAGSILHERWKTTWTSSESAARSRPARTRSGTTRRRRTGIAPSARTSSGLTSRESICVGSPAPSAERPRSSAAQPRRP